MYVENMIKPIHLGEILYWSSTRASQAKPWGLFLGVQSLHVRPTVQNHVVSFERDFIEPEGNRIFCVKYKIHTIVIILQLLY